MKRRLYSARRVAFCALGAPGLAAAAAIALCNDPPRGINDAGAVVGVGGGGGGGGVVGVSSDEKRLLVADSVDRGNADDGGGAVAGLAALAAAPPAARAASRSSPPSPGASSSSSSSSSSSLVLPPTERRGGGAHAATALRSNRACALFADARALFADARVIFGNPHYLAATAGATANSFAVGGLADWWGCAPRLVIVRRGALADTHRSRRSRRHTPFAALADDRRSPSSLSRAPLSPPRDVRSPTFGTMDSLRSHRLGDSGEDVTTLLSAAARGVAAGREG